MLPLLRSRTGDVPGFMRFVKKRASHARDAGSRYVMRDKSEFLRNA